MIGVSDVVDDEPATATLSSHDGFLWFELSAGPLPLYDLRVAVTYSELRANTPKWCKPDGNRVLCTVPTLPAGKNFVLPMKGSNISIVARYKREQSGKDFTRRAQ